ESAIAALGRLGRSVGLGPDETAQGVYRLAAEQMTLAVKGLLVERGLDPRRFAFVCYGGCGPLFGVPIARALGIGRVVVPGLAAVFSAFGAATAEVRHEAVRTFFRPLPIEAPELADAFAALEAEVGAAMAAEGIAPDAVRVGREVDLRFPGQTWEVTVPLATLAPDTIAGLGAAFRARYATLYGSGALVHAAGIDLVNCRVTATGGDATDAAAPAPATADPEVARRGARALWLPGADARARVPIYDGERLAPGMALVGPAVIERRDTTILLPAGDRAQVAAHGDLVVEVAGA